MEPQGLLPRLQVPATCPYSEPDQSSPWSPSKTWRAFLIISSHPRLGLPSGLFPHQYTVLSPIRATCPAHPFILDMFTRIILVEDYRSLSFSLCSFIHSPVTSFLLGSNILLSTLFSNTLSLRSTLNVSDQVSQPYKTTGKIILLTQ